MLCKAVRFLAAFAAAMFALPALAQSVTTVVNTTDGAVGSAQTCTAPLVRDFSVTASFILADVDLGVYVQHNQRGDIRVTLQSPDGTRVQVVDGNTVISGDHLNVLLDDSASTLVNTDGNNRNHSTSAPPFQNTYRPNAPLSAFNGKQANGIWRLEICDIRPAATNGTFRHAELYLTPQSADLSLTKQLIGAAPRSGGSVSWRLTVFSAASSTGTATGITVRDTLPGGFSVTGTSGTGTFNPATGVWSVGTLAPGEIAVMTITGTVSSAAGATVTNTAQITASSLPDPDSIVNNGVTSEDDYAASSFVVQSGRAAGIPPQLVCPTGYSVFDWGTISGWTPGSTDNTYAFASFGNIRFRLTNDGVYQNLAAYGGQSPTVSSTLTGGLAPAEPGLTVIADQANLAGKVEIEITLPRAFSGVQFTIFDVDFFANQFADRVEVFGRRGGTIILPVLTNGNVNQVTGNVAFGDGQSADTEPAGNVVVTFTDPVETIVIRYGNHTTAPANPGQQGISVHDLLVCNPYADLSVTKVSTLISDPVNGTTNPKAIPGALVEYLITVANTGTSATDPNSVVIRDQGPADAKLCLIARPGGPVIWNDPGGNSGLSYSFSSLGSASDSLEFSNNGGVSWNYTPIADASGCDAAVTDFRLRPAGAFSGGGTVAISVRYLVE
jgi:subtilisin-like proprotein convertase family protein